MQHNNFKKDIDLLSEAYDQVNEAIPAVVGMLGKAAAAGVARGVGAKAVDALTSDDSNEEAPIEDAEGGVVYVVETDAEYEDTQRHGIFTDFETAKKHAAEVELLPGFWVGITEVPLNKPEAEGKYHRL